MFSATVTDTGQITLPQEIRDRLKLVSGSQISFIIDEEGQVKLFPLNVPVEELSGMLHRPGMKKTTLEEMDRAISEGANDWT
ncbi:AbrB/MazE/SpoVT family DNA-binding domain-containing protein [Roseofilum reptotaenium CS-1145]|uniref:AbrB family transcriptional regulator n=1 Tax=Roseofilum reptotaenium AO1-A TaxID=1925591 RepID=A0A1L9QSF7_9CYAN|nr:AbrB/MazE/SpoVT family DNA-binding domain-containing protein [Roseofilum reptotaenium]MDB9519631.1 AbrB/MazE/SpoVT family DNA-binding domain-containing protein [Roseofilum reptotaenium CS-1145]OJJ25582.1 AbrB family transcriptional regulator [Roseofilum reptotaenium AO1-A]